MVSKSILIGFLLGVLSGGAGLAQEPTTECPSHYRFVDFGQIGQDGILYKGGTLVRVEAISGSFLIDREQTTCVTVPERSTDGHGVTIPVVKSFAFTARKLDLAVDALSLSSVADTKKATEIASEKHRQSLEISGSEIIRGERFLCVRHKDGVSCQLFSPYPGNLALVVYCSARICEIPAMAMDHQIVVSARWRLDKKPADLGTELLNKVSEIKGFLSDFVSFNRG
ncbi:MAG: hypothetical protein AAGA97_08330 [Pseudomonadota bacterium]